MTDTTRRAVIKGVVWAAPVVALAVAAPSAAASTPDTEWFCPAPTSDKTVKSVTFRGNFAYIDTAGGDGGAIDVTIRVQGYGEIHFNGVTQGHNPGSNTRPYKVGDILVVALPRPYRPGDDWFQVRTIHNENCVEVQS